MNKNRIARPARSDERADDREVHSHQRSGVVDSAGVRRRRSVLPRERSALCLGNDDRLPQGVLIAAQKSAEGIGGGCAPPKARTVEEVSRADISHEPCGRRIRSS